MFFFDIIKTKKERTPSESMNYLSNETPSLLLTFTKWYKNLASLESFYKIETLCCQNAKHYLQSPYSK